MEYRMLGDTGVEVSAVGLGTAPLGELFGPLDESAALRLVDEALDMGITYIDTSRYYGSAEARLGKALTPAKRAGVTISTKVGRYGVDDFDFSGSGVRRGIEESLRLLGTDHVDILLLHDIEFVDLAEPFEAGIAELQRIRIEGLCRYIGVSGYPLPTMERALEELDIDVMLTYAKGTLLDDSIREDLLPIAQRRGVSLINAAAVALGLLAPGDPRIVSGHPAPRPIVDAAARMKAACARRGIDIAFVANQYSIQTSGCDTTVVGSRKAAHLRSAVDAADAMLDHDLIEELIALRPPAGSRQWTCGLPQNN